MKQLLLGLLLGLSFHIYAQQADSLAQEGPKYQSLFWKIEHPDYNKPSYLYGTMHVSHKVAYHLSDAFYEALREVDQIALETNPEDWMDNMLKYTANPYGFGQNLYPQFAINFPKEKDLQTILKMNNQLVNGILYRNNEYQQNFEEETYLDMFIFQAGGKQGKPVLALEDLEVADQLVRKASSSAYDPDRELASWLEKKLEEKSIVQLTEDAYRDKNLDLIDSLNREFYNKEYNQYMLYERNYNMVDALDTVLLDGSVFVGIGAAHLPGEDGVIEILRERGFTVTPVEGELTQKGRNLKEDFEHTFADRPHQKYSTADNFIELELPEKMYEFGMRGQNISVSMDITNGAFFLIFRLPTYSALAKESMTLDDIEEMLYENIPGDIKKQERTTFQGYPAIWLENETKNGDHQKYLILETPLEFIVMKLAGKQDYASQFKDKYYDSIQLRQINAPTQVGPYYGGYQVTVPDNYTILGNNKIMSATQPIEIQCWDEEKEAYYFVRSVVFHDMKYIEEDAFEVEYLHKVFYDELDTTMIQIEKDMSDISTAISHTVSPTNDQPIWLKSIKKGPRYYLLGTVGLNEKEAKAYFNTFQFVDYDTSEDEYKETTDTSLHYTVVTPVEAPPYFDFYGSRNKEEDTIRSIYKNVVYETSYKEYIEVGYRKYHSYSEQENLDSLWANIDKRWETDDKTTDYQLEVFDKKKGKDAKGRPTYTFKVRREGASRIMHFHYILNYGVMYMLQYDTDDSSTSSPFIEKFVQTFSPQDTLIGRSPLAEKSSIFFENLESQDSLRREQALKAYSYVDFSKKDIPQLIQTIKEFKFEEDELKYKVGLLEALGEFEDKRVFDFLHDLYINSEYNSAIQLEVIHALASNPNTSNYKTITSLMKEDIPLANKNKIRSSFAPLKNDTLALPYSKEIFKDLWAYSSIPEYKDWIYELAEILKDEALIKPRIFKKYKKQLVNELKIEFKRQKTQDIIKKNKDNIGYRNNNRNGSASLLDEYISLLVPFYKDKEIRDVFSKVSTLDNVKTKATVQAQLAKHGHTTDKEMLLDLAQDASSRYDLYKTLEQYDQLSQFPKEYYNQQALAEAVLLNKSGYPKVDSTIFIKELSLETDDDRYTIYVFRAMKEKYSYYGNNDNDKEGDWGVQYIAYKENKNSPPSIKYYVKSDFQNIDHEDDKEMRELEKKALDKVRYKDRLRVKSYAPYMYDYN